MVSDARLKYEPAMQASAKSTLEWTVSRQPCGYAHAVGVMERRILQIAQGDAPERVWLVEHPPLYTAGTSAKASDLLNCAALPVHPTGRGGQFTYHGPGQQIAYVMLDVQARFGGDVRTFTGALESWLVGTLASLGVRGFTIAGRTGVWVDAPADTDDQALGREDAAKIAAIGLRIRRGISFHGVSLNVCPDLAHYDGIVPCGLAGSRVTSLAALGNPVEMPDVQTALRSNFAKQFAVRLIASDAPPDTTTPGSARGAARR